MTNRKTIILWALLVLGATFSLPSYAVPIGFNGAYDFSTWTSTNDIGGDHIATVNGPQTVLTLIEPDSCSVSGGPCGPANNFFSHTAVSTGTLSFDWSFNNLIDACCSGLQFYVNATQFNLAGEKPGDIGVFSPLNVSGSFSTSITAGDMIKFAAYSLDSCCQASTSIISNFDAPVAPVPEPTTLTLLGFGLAGLGFGRRKRAA